MEGLKTALESRQVVVAALATAAVVTTGAAYLTWRRYRRQYVPVGHVSKIYVHPVKSCRGLEVGEAEVTKQGLRLEGVMDRIWDIEGEAMDCGPEAADWLEKYFGKPGFKLVMSTPGLKKRCPVNHKRYKGIATKNDKVGFQEYVAMHLMTESSLDDLNSRMDNPVAMRVFRPNVVVSGSDPFQEDGWQYVRIGKAEFRKMLPCNRCLITTVNPETGVKEDQEPLRTLRSYRLPENENQKKLFGQTPLFGLMCGVEQEGSIHIGDTVYASV